MIPVRINHAVEIMLGVEASTIVNRNVELGVSSTPIDKTLASIIYSPKGSGESYDVFLPAPHNLKLRIFTIPKNNPRTKVQTGYIKILRDVTIETVVEQHKNDLISIVSHQLLTPLTGMKWIFKSLVAGDMGPLAPKQEDILKKGSEANEGMIDLVTDILDTAKVEQARFTYKIELSNIVATCHEVVVSRQEKAVTRSVTMVESYAIMEKVLKYDAERMNIALSNIIDNALDYSQKGSKIEVKIAPLLDGVTISIADHGIGIPEKAMARIFSKFYRAENAKRVRTSGTGLGLYLTKHIIEDHGGKIDINSKEGEGTTITVTLPGNLGVASIGHGNVASI
jgi:signal transduction histidine kinase